MHFGDDLVHLSRGESPYRCRVNIPRRSQMQEQGRGRLVVRGFKNEHTVVISQRPVNVRDLDAHLLARRLQRRRAFRRFVNAFDALLSELDRSDECCHVVRPVCDGVPWGAVGCRGVPWEH